MKRLAPLLVLALAAAACGGGSKSTTTTTTTAAVADPAAAMRALIATQPKLAGTVRTLFQGSGWAVVQSSSPGRASAVPFRLVGGRWRADQSDKVKLKILGPEPGSPGAPRQVQVAIEISAPQPFVESALWVDGVELDDKGGGSPTEGTIYATTAHPLKPGPHVAVGYARTDTTGTAVAWVFTVG